MNQLPVRKSTLFLTYPFIMSGRQNGENLFPSVRTVSVHVRGGGGEGEGEGRRGGGRGEGRGRGRRGEGEGEGEGDEQVLYSTLSSSLSSPSIPSPSLHKAPSAMELEASAPMEPSEISFAFIKMGSRIGEGHFSLVHKGTYTPSTGQPPICVAIKELKDTGGERALMMEARNMSQLDHSHIVKFYGFCRPDHRLMLITEFVQGGDLLHLLRQSSSVGRVMTLATQLRYSSQVANGMSYLVRWPPCLRCGGGCGLRCGCHGNALGGYSYHVLVVHLGGKEHCSP